MKAVVTGVAGFIGSHLAERCLQSGWTVVGIDSMTDYYARDVKERNLGAIQSGEFVFHEADLNSIELAEVLAGVDVVFHQAGQPGVRSSWADGFRDYVERNIEATQRLLEAAVQVRLPRFVFASSSSVYGAPEAFPTAEDVLPAPRSPYGVTKLAAEHMTGVYGASFGLPTVSLRYFTVYGPRQRPDMATERLLRCGLTGSTFELLGTGDAFRDFTFVGDVVEANLLAAVADLQPATVLNIAGGSSVSMNELIDAAGHAVGAPIAIERRDVARGDVPRTAASTERAQRLLGWEPCVDLAEGLARQTATIVDEMRELTR